MPGAGNEDPSIESEVPSNRSPSYRLRVVPGNLANPLWVEIPPSNKADTEPTGEQDEHAGASEGTTTTAATFVPYGEWASQMRNGQLLWDRCPSTLAAKQQTLGHAWASGCQPGGGLAGVRCAAILCLARSGHALSAQAHAVLHAATLSANTRRHSMYQQGLVTGNAFAVDHSLGGMLDDDADEEGDGGEFEEEGDDDQHDTFNSLARVAASALLDEQLEAALDHHLQAGAREAAAAVAADPYYIGDVDDEGEVEDKGELSAEQLAAADEDAIAARIFEGQ